MPNPMFDENGYPTDKALEKLETFYGTLEDYIQFIRDLWVNGWITVGHIEPDWTRKDMELKLVTGGWSGNESVLQAMDNTVFSLMFWQSSHRGGLETYRFPESDLKHKMFWGKIEKYVAK